MDEDYYSVLGIEKTATQGEIKKSYRKLARKYHPDKTDDKNKEEYTKKFQKIGSAYEILSDPEKRDRYDRGDDDIGNFQGTNPFDFFSSFFSGFGNPRTNNNFAKKRTKKSVPVVHQVNISLKDLFNGKNLKLKITSKTIFKKDEKTPYKDVSTTWNICTTCDGNGMVMEVRQVTPGFVTQNKRPCHGCLGTGNTLKEGFILKNHENIVEIDIKRGMDIKSPYVIPSGGNCYPGTLAGDIIIEFWLSEDQVFKMVGNDLYMNKEILLSEALCGFGFYITHLDGNDIFIKSKNIISPGFVKRIEKQGMYDKFGLRGDLVIKFDIKFPESLLTHQKKNIRKYLPKPKVNNNGKNSNNTIFI